MRNTVGLGQVQKEILGYFFNNHIYLTVPQISKMRVGASWDYMKDRSDYPRVTALVDRGLLEAFMVDGSTAVHYRMA